MYYPYIKNYKKKLPSHIILLSLVNDLRLLLADTINVDFISV